MGIDPTTPPTCVCLRVFACVYGCIILVQHYILNTSFSSIIAILENSGAENLPSIKIFKILEVFVIIHFFENTQIFNVDNPHPLSINI